MVFKTPDERRHAQLLAAAMRDLRIDRRLRASDVAQRMGLPLRTYERFEAGLGPITYDRLVRFAQATASDVFALLAVLPFGDAAFARHCADNKLMTIIMMSVLELSETLGEDVAYLDPKTLIGAFTRATTDLAEHFHKRDTFAENWLERRSHRIDLSTTALSGQLRRRSNA